MFTHRENNKEELWGEVGFPCLHGRHLKHMLVVLWGWILVHSGLGKIWIRSQNCSTARMRECHCSSSVQPLQKCLGCSGTDPYKPFCSACPSQEKSPCRRATNLPQLLKWLLCLCFYIFVFSNSLQKKGSKLQMGKPPGRSPQVGISLFLWRVYSLAQVLGIC